MRSRCPQAEVPRLPFVPTPPQQIARSGTESALPEPVAGAKQIDGYRRSRSVPVTTSRTPIDVGRRSVRPTTSTQWRFGRPTRRLRSAFVGLRWISWRSGLNVLFSEQDYRFSRGGSGRVGGFWPFSMYPISSLLGRNGGGAGRFGGGEPFGCASWAFGFSDMDVASGTPQRTRDDERCPHSQRDDRRLDSPALLPHQGCRLINHDDLGVE